MLIAAACFLLAGGAVERALGLGAGFPFHRIALGQMALVAWFYLRSPLAHAGLFGVHRLELFALAALLGLWQARSAAAETDQPLGKVFVWLALWATLFLALAPRSGLLYTPSSDPDHHAFFARLTAQAGEVLYTMAPRIDAALRYPSGFSVQGALWMNLGLLSPVQAVNLQPALQTFLLLGLLVEAAIAARGRVEAVPLLLLVVVAHFGFFLFVNGDRPGLEGTPRLSDGAMLLLPLTIASRSSSAWAAASLACTAWVFTQNPAHAPVTIPAILGGALVVAISPGGPRLRLWPLAAGAAFSLLVVASDAWVHNEMPLRLALAQAAPHAAVSAPMPAQSESPILAGLRGAAGNSALAILPRGCIPSAQCRPYLDLLREWAGPLLLLLALLALWRGPRRPAALVLGAGAAIWIASFMAEAVGSALPAGADLGMHLLRSYMQEGFISSTPPLFILELMAGAALVSAWLAGRTLRASPALATAAILGAALFAVTVADPAAPEAASEAYSSLAATAPRSTLGTIQRADLEFIGRAAPQVSGRLLTPGYAALSNPWEAWVFPLSGGRAVPLYTDLPLAWFEYTPEFTAASYVRHVCRALDLRWLREHGIRFILETPDEMRLMCVHALPVARKEYLATVLREGERALYALREDRIDEAERDPRLGLPQSAPPRGRKGAGVVARLAIRGPYGVSGWACDRGSSSPVGVQLDLSSGGHIYREIHPAALPAGDEARAACASNTDVHGFRFAPVVAPAGTYQARLSVWDAAGDRAQVVAEGFTLTLPF